MSTIVYTILGIGIFCGLSILEITILCIVCYFTDTNVKTWYVLLFYYICILVSFFVTLKWFEIIFHKNKG